MKIQKLDFSKNFNATTDIQALIGLGWEFDTEDTQEALKLTPEEAMGYVCSTYDIEITVNEDGQTFWNYFNAVKYANGIFEGSDREATGDDAQTIKDLRELHERGELHRIGH